LLRYKCLKYVLNFVPVQLNRSFRSKSLAMD
jgi:hypothetical protein